MSLGPQHPGYAADYSRSYAGSAALDGFALRVGILHGNRLCGELLSTHCRAAWGCAVVAVEQATDEGLQAIERERPDLVIVGHHPPTLDSLEVVSALERHAGIKIVV